jgi:hypothetical protein
MTATCLLEAVAPIFRVQQLTVSMMEEEAIVAERIAGSKLVGTLVRRLVAVVAVVPCTVVRNWVDN